MCPPPPSPLTELAAIARTFRHGASIPRVKYTAEEVATWGAVFEKQEAMLQKFACKEYLDILPLMKKFCGYSVNNIPQVRLHHDREMRLRGSDDDGWVAALYTPAGPRHLRVPAGQWTL